ncbi:MAG: hypothetical protein JKX87_07735 [Cycloclasticus sp.]|nr:hypothetical protein [Cycloclasticus sp.]
MTADTLSLDEKKAIIIKFLQQCNHYSDGMLDKYREQLNDVELEGVANQKIHDWGVYKDFNDYAMKELVGQDLDDWFK